MEEKLKELFGNKDFLEGLKDKVNLDDIKKHLQDHGIEDVDGDGLDFDDIKAKAEGALKGLMGDGDDSNGEAPLEKAEDAIKGLFGGAKKEDDAE